MRIRTNINNWQVYRRRDLRNGLADRLGISARDQEPRARDRKFGARSKRNFHDRRRVAPPKRLLRLKNIPLEVSDYQIEDWAKEIGEIESIRISDKRESRVSTIEFKDANILSTAQEILDGKEVKDLKLEAEIFETGSGRRERMERTPRPSVEAPVEERKFKSKEELDQEMDEYMAQ